MNAKYISIKILPLSRQRLHMIGGVTGENLFEVVDRLTREESERLKLPLDPPPPIKSKSRRYG